MTRFRDLDNSLTTLQQQGKDVFETPATDTVEGCDGWDDPDEVAQSTNTNNPFDFPGAPPAVPGLSGWGLSLLVCAMLFSALFQARYQWSARTMTR